MSYIGHDWTTGETITASKLNAIEDGLQNASGTYIDLGDSIEAVFLAAYDMASMSGGEASIGVQLTAEQAQTLMGVSGLVRHLLTDNNAASLCFTISGVYLAASVIGTKGSSDTNYLDVVALGAYPMYEQEGAFLTEYRLAWETAQNGGSYGGNASVTMKLTPITWVNP